MKLTMKLATIIPALTFLSAVNLPAQIVETNLYSQSVNVPVPDANPNGYNTSLQVSNVIGVIQNISVFLNITGGFNGDLYAFLVNPNGDLAVLLNRTGVGGANSFGYGDSGFDLSFNAGAAGDIHYYQTLDYSLNGGGQLTGTWAADGRYIDPQSIPSVFDAAARTHTLDLFLGGSPNGEWTLFVADLNSEYQSTLVSWGMQIETVPEPSAVQMLSLGSVIGGVMLCLRRRSAPNNR